MPALYWNYATASASKSDVLNSAVKVMKDAGYSSVSKGTDQTSGSKGDVFAFIGSVEKVPPPKASGGLGTTTPGSQSVIIVAAGNGAKAAAADLGTRWSKVKFW